MIVVEGPDGSGKTTLAKWIAENCGLEYRRAPTLSSETGPDDKAVFWFEDQLVGKTAEGGVYDRVFIISEPIYQLASPGRPLMRNERYMTAHLQRFLNTCKLLIFCLPPWETARDNMDADGRLTLQGVDREMFRKIHWMYSCQADLYKEAMFETVTIYDYTRMNKSHIEEAVYDLVLKPTAG